MTEIDLNELDFDFLKSEDEVIEEIKETYKIIIADDDIEVHNITRMALDNFEFEGRILEIINTYSGKETRKAMADNPDTAILLLDVVMEETKSGLDVVDYLRKTLDNQMTRIILRTGQPGEAPKESVIREYEINDYLLKTELTVQKLYAALLTGLRSFRDLQKLENHKKGLEKIIETSANLFHHSSFSDFLNSILNEMSHFYKNTPSILYLAKNKDDEKNGFVSIEKYNKTTIVAATGKYQEFIGKEVDLIPELEFISNWMKIADFKSEENIKVLENGFIIKSSGLNQLSNYIFIDGNNEDYDFNLIKLFLKNYSTALDNYFLNNTILVTQKEIIFALGEANECQFGDYSDHARRVSEMMYKFSLLNNYSNAESEILKIASTMHDVGNIGIPVEILKKPGKLTEEEFEVVKKHTTIGHSILTKNKLEVLQIAAEIALSHHEKYDGTGYPIGLSGKLIPYSARMMSILDVFDTMTHTRTYKDSESVEVAIVYIKDNIGKHFDPILSDIFIKNLDKIIVL